MMNSVLCMKLVTVPQELMDYAFETNARYWCTTFLFTKYGCYSEKEALISLSFGFHCFRENTFLV